MIARMLASLLIVVCASYAPCQDYNRVDGFLFDKELQAKSEKLQQEGSGGPLSQLVDRRVNEVEQRLLEKIRTNIDAIVESRLRERLESLPNVRDLQLFREKAEELEKRWTPLQTLVDRLSSLLLKLIFAVILLAVLVVLIAGLLTRVYRKINPLSVATSGMTAADLFKVFQK